MDIVKSIHMIPLNSKMATRGPYLIQAVVVGGTSKPVRDRKADLIRDIAAIEYGGPATDSSGGMARRTEVCTIYLVFSSQGLQKKQQHI